MLEIPKNIKIKIFFQTDINDFRGFYWLEMKDDDLYWGPLQKVDMISYNFDSVKKGPLSFSVPEKLESFNPRHTKYSYHKSGNVHLKRSLANETLCVDCLYWPLKNQITEPKIIYSIISSQFKFYPVYKKKIQSKKCHPIVIGIPANNDDERLYMEFILSPEGTYTFKPPVINIGTNNLQFITHSINKKLILILRFAKINAAKDLVADKEITIMQKVL